MPDTINSHICLMLRVYTNFYQAVKYGQQRNHILQDLIGLEIKISMKASKTKNRFETGFNRFAKKLVLTSLPSIHWIRSPCHLVLSTR